MSRTFFMPQVTITGSGSLTEEADRLILGSKALIVTGKTVVKQDCTKKLLAVLDEKDIAYSIFTGITGEPTDTMIEEGAKAYREGGCDFIIAIGGGSPMDSMKAIAVMLKYPDKKLREFMGKEIEGPFVPMAAIPTTAGTGSEVTMFTVITDTQTEVKMLLKGAKLIPDVAVVDPLFSLSAPRSVTANTGLDALTHAIEAYTSRKAQPLTDVLAVSAVKRIMKYLPIAYEAGDDVEAREQMALAAYEAGICITNSSVTLVHGMSRPIGALFHVPHGLSNAMLLPDCLEFAADGIYPKFAGLGRAVEAADDKMTDEAAAKAFIKKVRELCEFCNVPDICEYGIDKNEFITRIDKMADDAIISGSPSNTVKEVKKEDCINIYRKLLK